MSENYMQHSHHKKLISSYYYHEIRWIFIVKKYKIPIFRVIFQTKGDTDKKSAIYFCFMLIIYQRGLK